MTEHVKREISDGLMTLTLQRPEKKNALSGAMYDALSDAVRQADVDASVRVVLFQGDGDSFTAGNDMADFARQSGAENSAESPVRRFIEAISMRTSPWSPPYRAMLSASARPCFCIAISSISLTMHG